MTRIVASREINGVMFRTAVPADIEAIEAVMRASVRELSRGFYDEGQIPSVERFIALLDPALGEDGTYFVGEAPRPPVGCRGWRARGKLVSRVGGGGPREAPSGRAGVGAMCVLPEFARRGLGRAILDLCEEAARAEQFRRLELMATLPGVPLYIACGFVVVERVTITLPDGVEVG